MDVGQLVSTLTFPQTSIFVNDFPLFILATDAPFGGTKDGSRVVESPLESILRSKSTWLYVVIVNSNKSIYSSSARYK